MIHAYLAVHLFFSTILDFFITSSACKYSSHEGKRAYLITLLFKYLQTVLLRQKNTSNYALGKRLNKVYSGAMKHALMKLGSVTTYLHSFR